LTPSSNPTALADHFCRLFSTTSLPSGVLAIAIATSSPSLHPLLNAKHIFGETIKISAPNKELRREVRRDSRSC